MAGRIISIIYIESCPNPTTTSVCTFYALFWDVARILVDPDQINPHMMEKDMAQPMLQNRKHLVTLRKHEIHKITIKPQQLTLVR